MAVFQAAIVPWLPFFLPACLGVQYRKGPGSGCTRPSL